MAEYLDTTTFYKGTVEYVIKGFGFITLQHGKPVKRAYFDRKSVYPRPDDLTDLFSKGSKIQANITLTDGEHKVKHKAINVRCEHVEDPSISGGKNYLKKYLLDNGSLQLEQLVEKLETLTRNCPKFLRSGNVEDVRKVVNSHPNVFQIKLGFLYLVQEEKELLDEILSNMESYNNKIPIDSVNSIIRPDHDYRRYLHTTEQWNVGIKNFVARNADSLVFWDNAIWNWQVVVKNPQLNSSFQKELNAVKYYSEFVTKKGPLAVSSLSGHYNQASEEIKDVAKQKSEDFLDFLEKHSFFFIIKGGMVKDCPEYRLAAIDDHWKRSKRPRTRAKKSFQSRISQDIASQLIQNLRASQSQLSQYSRATSPPISPLFGQDCFQKNQDPRFRCYMSQGDSGKGGKQYLERHLPDNGAYPPLTILIQLHEQNDINCPPYLKWGHFQELILLAQQNPMIFSIHNGILCLNELENQLVATCIAHEKIDLAEVRSVFPRTEQPGKYLFASAPSNMWTERVKDFVARHPDRFVFWQNFIWRKDALFEDQLNYSIFGRDMKAVKYYSRFMSPIEAIEIVSVSGHYGQADNDVKMATTQNTEDFTTFLKRNFFFFDIRKDKVKLSAEGRRKEIMDKHWCNRTVKSPTKPKPATRPKTPKDTATSVPKLPSKAFSDFAAETAGKPVMCSSEDAYQNANRLNFQTFVNCPPLLHQSQSVEMSTGPTSPLSSKGASSFYGSIFDSEEALVLKRMIGDEISSAIESEALSIKGSTLNSVLLLRLNVGKKPMAKFRLPVDNGSFNCALEISPVKAEDLQRILRQSVIVKSATPSHFGVKGTLHSMRSLEQGGKISGLTIFCQIHENSDELLLDIQEGKKLTAVFTGDYPTKFIYNYLRCRCKELAQREDVLVLDVDGQLSGCDEHPHSSLGEVSRIQCSSSAELSDQINLAIQHMHEYVVIIGVDSTNHLKSIQKMCSKDTKVIAEISSEMKSEVENMFM